MIAQETEKKVVFIGLGSNIGDRQGYLDCAIEAIRRSPGINLLGRSRVSETEPVDNPNQPRFLNQVISIGTSLSPRDLLARLQSIEAELGRERLVWKGPRTIDLDILLYDDLVMRDDALSIPHRELLNRPFFMRQILEVDPGAIDPVSRRPLIDHLVRVSC